MREGWEIKKLGDVCYSKSSNVSQNQLADEVGDYPIFGASGLIKNISFYHRDKPYLSIVKDGSGFGRITKMDAFTSVIGTLQYILPNDEIDLDYLNYTLMSVDFKKYVQGAAIPHIYFKDYKNEPFLWMPLPEQQRIVSILDEAFSAIDKAKANAEQNLKNAKELFESYLQSVFEKKGEGWVTKELMEVCEQITDGSHFSPKSSGIDEYPYITVRDIDEDIIDFDKCKFICEKDYQSLLKNGCKPNSGDLLFSKDGTVGKVSLVDFEKDFVVLSSLAIIRPKSKIITSSLLKYILKDPSFLQTAIGMKTGVAIRRIILKNLKLIEISFPKSLIEQQTIVQKLDTLSVETKKLETIYQQKLVNLEELKKSVLQKAFNGELN